MTEMKFFVYGSFSEGLVHFNKIKEFVIRSQPASIQGAAYRLSVGYPVVLAEGNDLVPGQLVHLNTTDLLVNLLDEFHGFNQQDEAQSLYFRRQQLVRSENGDESLAWTYFLNPSKLPSTATLIEGGDWKTSLQSQPPITEQLSERQKAHILRLGRVTGREIVPIDLPLYRELMNLGMIVDKGRRLALSRTGNEVFRYLS